MRHVRILGVCLAALFAMSAVTAGSALALETSELEHFKTCPLKNVLVKVCTFGSAEGGHFTVGPITVPITNPIHFQGGYYENGAGQLEFILPVNGQAVTPTAETVPGEPLANVTPAEQKEFEWPEALAKSYENARITGMLGAGTMTEVIESAGVPGLSVLNLVFEEGNGIVAPVQITGKTKWLEKLGGKRGNCKIGSSKDPIVQHLTSGASTSSLTGETIHGSAGSLEIEGGGELARLVGTHLVDNTYATPAAEGCGGYQYERYLDPVVNRAFGLPSPAGANVTELLGFFETSGVALLKQYHIK